MHWNCEKYSSFSEAVDKHDGLAVLGVMIQVTRLFLFYRVCAVANISRKYLSMSFCALPDKFRPSNKVLMVLIASVSNVANARIVVIQTPVGNERLSFHDSWGGARGQNLGHL